MPNLIENERKSKSLRKRIGEKERDDKLGSPDSIQALNSVESSILI